MQKTIPSTEQLTGELFSFITFLLKGAQRDVVAFLAELDLSVSQLRALFVLDGRDEELALHELAGYMHLSVAAASRAVDALAREGLVTRAEDPVDRRVKRIAITDAGRESVGRLAAARRDGLHRFVETLDDAERERLSSALQPILARPELRSCPAEASR